MRFLFLLLAALVAAVPACRKSESAATNAEIEAAIRAYLEQRSNVMLANMTLEMGEVKVTDDTAEASVTFRSKQQPDATAGVVYHLRRQDSGWQVVSTGGMGGDPHGTPPARPADHPPTAKAPRETPLQPSH